MVDLNQVPEVLIASFQHTANKIHHAFQFSHVVLLLKVQEYTFQVLPRIVLHNIRALAVLGILFVRRIFFKYFALDATHCP